MLAHRAAAEVHRPPGTHPSGLGRIPPTPRAIRFHWPRRRRCCTGHRGCCGATARAAPMCPSVTLTSSVRISTPSRGCPCSKLCRGGFEVRGDGFYDCLAPRVFHPGLPGLPVLLMGVGGRPASTTALMASLMGSPAVPGGPCDAEAFLEFLWLERRRQSAGISDGCQGDVFRHLLHSRGHIGAQAVVLPGSMLFPGVFAVKRVGVLAS